MIGLRGLGNALLSVVVLSLWLGAAVTVAAVVAPAAFAVLPTRTLAGALVGRVLPVLFWSGVVAGAATALLARSRPHALARMLSGLAMVVACAAAQLVVAPRIERVRASVTGPVDQLPPGDARRAAFGRFHAVSVALLGAAAVASALSLTFTVRTLVTASAHDAMSNPLHEH